MFLRKQKKMQKSKFSIAIALVLINLFSLWFFEIKAETHEVLIIHAFLFPLFFLTELVQKICIGYKNQPQLILSINFFRIIACVGFLFFNYIADNNHEKIYIYNFILVYFSLLFSDIFLKLKRTRK